MRLMFDRSVGLSAVEVDFYLMTLWLLRLSGLHVLSERMITIERAIMFPRCPDDAPNVRVDPLEDSLGVKPIQLDSERLSLKR